MAYSKQTWKNYPDTSTPITAERLDHIEQGIYDASISAESAVSKADTASTNASNALKAANEAKAKDLGNLSSVTISNPTEGQILSYDATSKKWVNTTVEIAEEGSY